MAKKNNVVLDDGLYREYHGYKHPESGIEFSKNKISRILRFAGNDVLTNAEQWKRLGIGLNNSLGANLMKMPEKKASLEELAKKTGYKIILTDNPANGSFPYVNIDGDEIDVVLGGFVMRNRSRDKAIKHLAAICRDAKDVILYDKFFSERAEKISRNVDILTAILPAGRNLIITYHKDNTGRTPHISEECKNEILGRGITWTFSDKILPDHHDRYLIIDNKTEIILTSGFDHLGSTENEITYIIRDCNSSRRF